MTDVRTGLQSKLDKETRCVWRIAGRELQATLPAMWRATLCFVVLAGCGSTPSQGPVPHQQVTVSLAPDPPAPTAPSAGTPEPTSEPVVQSPAAVEMEAQPRRWPVPSTLQVIGIIHAGATPRVVLRDADGFGWVMHLGDVRGGEKLTGVAPDHCVLESESDRTQKRLKLGATP